MLFQWRMEVYPIAQYSAVDPNRNFDLMYEIYVRQVVEAGLADSQAGKVISAQEVRAKFGLPE